MHTRGIRLFYESRMADFLGIIELIAWVLAVVTLAAVVTYAVIKGTQKIEKKRDAAKDAATPTNS